MKVFVYFNLHKKCYSIKALQSEGGVRKGTVFAHASEVFLLDCRLKVSEAGRQRVIRTKRKNVHAGVVGELIFFYTEGTSEFADDANFTNGIAKLRWIRATYNPYKAPYFVDYDTRQKAMAKAQVAWLLGKSMWLRDAS